MGRPPAVVIVARHGARLDAADTQWHLTSPTPYDPPLTYGGWRQSQALGARIASIVHFRETPSGSQISSGLRAESEVNGAGEQEEGRNPHHSYRGKRRKHKVVIHTSPFLRCIQTSVAISAGMTQHQDFIKANSHPSLAKHALHSASPHIRGMDHAMPPRLSAIPEPEASDTSERNGRHSGKDPRTLLRVDAFLGEWLSPSYFDKITPPPESKLMVAGAKAVLLRRGDPVDTVHPSDRMASSQGHFPGGWGSGPSAHSKVQSSDEETPLPDLSSLSQGLPRLSRANSHSPGTPSKGSSLSASSRVERSPTPESLTYVAPTPSYAISPSQPIPQGYVAHARDACVKVDYQWDSLRPPLEWGNGGEYGEEWSSMHKRFRHGLHEMICWYRGHEPAALVRTLSEGLPESQTSETPDDEEMDTVLVLVTHGAGCNALIGALTNQPVLIDVGMASLTMAVQKTIEYTRVASPCDPNPPTSPSRRRHSVIDLGISDDYEVKLIASTEHLRAGSQFMAGTKDQRTATLPVREKSPYRYERPEFASSHPGKSTAIAEERGTHSAYDDASNSPLGGIKRSATAAVKSSGGLWSKPVVDDAFKEGVNHPSPRAGQQSPVKPTQLDGAADGHSGVLHERPNGSLTNGNGADLNHAKTAPEHDSEGRSIAPSGLWGAPPHALSTERDAGTKRRWTMSQSS